jgi:acetyltransferase-like isoleucine patch superfamily enzyme
MAYRNLTQQEIDQLVAAGCEARDWQEVYVDGGDVSYIRNVRFSGTVRFGRFEREFEFPGGLKKHSGLKNATLHNVTIGDNCLIENISNYIANYTVGHDSVLENVDLVVTDGPCRFGNGVGVSVLNETGGRDVHIYDRLSAQVAYVMAMYRHRPEVIQALDRLVEEYAKSQESMVGTIGNNVFIRNTRYLDGVRIGDNAVISGVNRLRNGSVNSNAAAPVTISHGVIADDFIICSGCHIQDSTSLTRCFIGQSCHFGHGYSASDSLFFSNCQGENGEACAIFAGPFTVTHHKSTLLIAGHFSFMNAGSGSNQSNHMYKLGPIHQGILERGAKTSSDSYILWPSRVGAFSLVMGRHVNHSDTTWLPFSYLIEQQNTTYLVPGVNLRSVGTIRDAQKWPKRDGRTDPDKLDCINYNLLSPYTIHKMFKGIQLLKNLQHSSGELSDVYSYHSAKIRNGSLKRGLELYRTAITKFLGNSIIKKLENLPAGASDEVIRAALKPEMEGGEGKWTDLSGLIAPKRLVDSLLDRIESGEVSDLETVDREFRQMHADYYRLEWSWAYDKYADFFGFPLETITALQVRDIVMKWKAAVIGLDEMLYEDARKEFNLASMTGFGADGSREDKELDFEQVRGAFESNSFVKAVLEHIRVKRALGDELLGRLRQDTD